MRTIDGGNELGDTDRSQARNTLQQLVCGMFATLSDHRSSGGIAQCNERIEFLIQPFGPVPCSNLRQLPQPLLPLLLLINALTGTRNRAGSIEALSRFMIRVQSSMSAV